MKPLRLALLGATSHIAKGLAACWCDRTDRELLLYARAPERVRHFLAGLPATRAEVFPIEAFGAEPLDVAINCVGIASPQRLREHPEEIFQVTARFDDLVLGYLAQHPETLYVSLSSGAAYGTDFSRPVDDSSRASFSLNELQSEEFYGIAKLHSEARHRALSRLSIVDLRIFGYFSRYLDLSERFLLSDILSCLKERRTLVTNPAEIFRDFLHPQDLAALIDCCIGHGRLNRAFDAYSRKEAGKFEILDYFAAEHGLRYRIEGEYQPQTATGRKDRYYATGRRAQEIGYLPRLSSLEGIHAEASAIIRTW